MDRVAITLGSEEQEMTMRLKERELVGVAVSVAAGCRPCTDFHIGAARKARASVEEIRQAIEDAIAIRRDAADVMEHHALGHLGAVQAGSGCEYANPASRVDKLIAIGAAFAVNCTTSLEKHVAAAESLGISDDDIRAVAKLASFIKGKAASHVEKRIPAEVCHAAGEQEAPVAAGCC